MRGAGRQIGLPLAEASHHWRLHYVITNDENGSPITGVPAIDPLTGTVLASTPSVTVTAPTIVYASTCEEGDGQVVNPSQIVANCRCEGASTTGVCNLSA